MVMGIVGRKCGMTRVFKENGDSVPVTVIQVDPNVVTQIKSLENDGYCAVQVTTGKAKVSRVNKATAGHYAKAKTEAGKGLWEFRLETENTYKLGDKIDVDLFSEGQKIDVVATSRGKGFAGVIKRYNFKTQDATHGNSLAHRAPGSIGQNQTPGRVFKGKKMAGQMGNERVTVQNQEVVKVDVERHLILIKGTVPGAPGGFVVIKPTAKQAVAA